ncbi:MAG TPA: extracellular solute-binding protein [Dehalococcoidia bacterium]|nr:extracellular solute-binding protein [Dehalococcoidia bacterium]
MTRWLLSLVLLAGLMALSACAAEEKATPAPASPTGATKPAWEQEWERVLAAAKQEGKVVVAGQEGAERRRALTEPFEKKYGITVEHYGESGRTLAQRIRTEREAGQYLWDVFVGGGNTPLQVLAPIGALDPIESALILPEAKDPKNWFGGILTFFDDQHMLINMFASKSPPIWFAPSVVKPGEITGFKDLLDPKWKGKIVADDPTVTGAGRSKWRFMAVNRDLGPDYIRALLKQDITFTRDEEQTLRSVVAGQYPVCIGCNDALATTMRKQGLAIEPLVPKEGIDITGGWGQVGLMNKAPHPNAARVYINWILGKEGQVAVAPTGPYASLRVDVPTGYLEPYAIPKPTDTLLNTDPRQRQAEAIITPIFKEVLGR